MKTRTHHHTNTRIHEHLNTRIHFKHMKFTSTYQHFQDSPIWSGHVVVPVEVVKYFKTKNIKRFVCTFQDQVKSHLSIQSDGKGGHYILLNKDIAKQIQLKVGEEVSIVLEEDTSKYGMPLPEEMEELLLQDSEGEHYFHMLTPGKQRSLLYIVGKPKGTDTRLKKAITILNYLKHTGGKLDMKELNQAFKDDVF